MSKLTKIIPIVFLLLACAGTQKNMTIDKEYELPFISESTTVATRIVELEGIKGFIVKNIDNCHLDIEYRFESYNENHDLIESGIYVGIGRVPYLVELYSDAFYVLIYSEF